MQFVEELLPGTWLIRLKRFDDARGSFVKTFARSVFDAALSNGVPGFAAIDIREEFYSTSVKDVIRGMHFQLPPHDHAKLVYCAVGAVDDVLLDLRQGSNYGRVASVRLDSREPCAVLVPSGVAHGFRSLSDDSLMVYKTSTEHAPSHDAGVRFDSFGFDWQCPNPILSARDQAHPAFTGFSSPF
jgi:dTDP-4-dehydrorhamnose 3,5-epimerase/CDP-3, 6-dideoxy-D-glycero-D-glycero-4-hexulose-5-epimerase